MPNSIKGVMSRSNVDTLSELCSAFLKGGNAAFIAATASGLFLKNRISVTQITKARIEIKWNLTIKT